MTTEKIGVLITGRNPKALENEMRLEYLDLLERELNWRIVFNGEPLKTEDQVIRVLEQNWGLRAVVASIEPYGEKVLRWIAAHSTLPFLLSRNGVGYEKILIALAKELGIGVGITPGSNDQAVAQHTMSLLLAALNNLPTAHATFHDGEWSMAPANELFDKTVLIVGISGRIGKAFTLRCLASGAHVLGNDTFWDSDWVFNTNMAFRNPVFARTRHLLNDGTLVTEQFFPKITRADDLDAALPRADVVSLHLNLTDATRGFIDKRRLGLMRPKTVLVNCARGPLVVERDIVEACHGGRVRYAVDVFDEEPVPETCPLLRCKNVVATPHMAAAHVETAKRQTYMAVQNVRDWLEGNLISLDGRWIVWPA